MKRLKSALIALTILIGLFFAMVFDKFLFFDSVKLGIEIC